MIRISIKILRYTLKILFVLLILLLLVAYIEYMICPVYDFPAAKTFSGGKIYNPYDGMNKDEWRKCNFQVQSRAWGGVTDGEKNTNYHILQQYRGLNYDIITISDYQKINKYNSTDSSYIPVYEHGYGIKKTHQLGIGSEKVLWLDYPFLQNIHHKQHIINSLRNNNDLIAIAHPGLFKAYKYEDMKKLTNYDLIEVISNFDTAFTHWDAALSSGHLIYIIGNDDAHFVNNAAIIGNYFTNINAPSSQKDEIIDALKNGKAYVVGLIKLRYEEYEDKRNRVLLVPALNSVSVSNDTLFIDVSRTAQKFKFIGQNGTILKVGENCDHSFYKIQPEDTYVRTEIRFEDHTTFYLNPVHRYSGNDIKNLSFAKINQSKTWIKRIIYFVVLFFALLLIVRIVRKRNKTNDKMEMPLRH